MYASITQQPEQHSVTMTHAQVLDAFVRHASEDVLVVLEYDALAHTPQVQAAADHVRNMTTDLLSLGDCAGGWTTGSDCMHAYATTKRGAKLLLEQLDHCGEPLAQQVRNMRGLTMASAVATSAEQMLIAPALQVRRCPCRRPHLAQSFSTIFSPHISPIASHCLAYCLGQISPICGLILRSAHQYPAHLVCIPDAFAHKSRMHSPMTLACIRP